MCKCDDNEDEGIPQTLKIESQPKKSIADISNKKCDSYQDVIKFQNTSGYFTDLPSGYRYLLSEDVPESVSSLIDDEDVIKLVWTTIFAICILKKDFADNKGEWIMIVKKGESYLKSQGVNNYKKEISNAISLL